jgi:hypothetical protein
MHYFRSRKVAGPIPNEVIEFFNWPNLSSRTMALGSTQPLTEMSTWTCIHEPTEARVKLTAVTKYIDVISLVGGRGGNLCCCGPCDCSYILCFMMYHVGSCNLMNASYVVTSYRFLVLSVIHPTFFSLRSEMWRGRACPVYVEMVRYWLRNK